MLLPVSAFEWRLSNHEHFRHHSNFTWDGEGRCGNLHPCVRTSRRPLVVAQKRPVSPCRTLFTSSPASNLSPSSVRRPASASSTSPIACTHTRPTHVTHWLLRSALPQSSTRGDVQRGLRTRPRGLVKFIMRHTSGIRSSRRKGAARGAGLGCVRGCTARRRRDAQCALLSCSCESSRLSGALRCISTRG